MLRIRTAYNKTGLSVTATATIDGKRIQRSHKVSANGPADRDHGLALGTLLNVLTDSRQQAMLRHPSGGQRVRVVTTGQPYASAVWTVNV